MVMFSRLTPRSHHRFTQEMAAAPAPEHDNLDLVDLLADDLQAVEHGGAGNDRGAVLVIVEDRNVHPRLEFLFDVEAFRRLDVFEVDAAERRLEGGDHVDQLVRVVLGQFDVEDVNTGEFLEQAALAFHDRLGSQRADIAETEHGGAVGNDTNQIGARGHTRRQSPGLQQSASQAAATPGE